MNKNGYQCCCCGRRTKWDVRPCPSITIIGQNTVREETTPVPRSLTKGQPLTSALVHEARAVQERRSKEKRGQLRASVYVHSVWMGGDSTRLAHFWPLLPFARPLSLSLLLLLLCLFAVASNPSCNLDQHLRHPNDVTQLFRHRGATFGFSHLFLSSVFPHNAHTPLPRSTLQHQDANGNV